MKDTFGGGAGAGRSLAAPSSPGILREDCATVKLEESVDETRVRSKPGNRGWLGRTLVSLRGCEAGLLGDRGERDESTPVEDLDSGIPLSARNREGSGTIPFE